MTNANQFVPFATGTGANVESPTQWADETVVQQGFQSGLASSTWVNTALRQATSIASAVAQFIANYGTSNVDDNGNITELEEEFVTALTLFISGALPTQLIYNGLDSGTANAAVVSSTNPAIGTPAAFDVFILKKTTSANTGAMTLQIASTTATLEWADGSALASGDWPASTVAIVIYDGTVFRYWGAIGPSIFARVSQLPSTANMVHYGTASGTANALTVTFSPSISALQDGMLFEVTPSLSNTSSGGVTLNPNGLGAASVTYRDGSNLLIGEIQAGEPFICMALSGNLIYMSPPNPQRTALFTTSSTTPQSLANGATNAYAMASASGPFGSWSSSTFTFTQAGVYAVSASLVISTSSSATATNYAWAMYVNKNGSTVPGGESIVGNWGNSPEEGVMSATPIINAAVGDTLQVLGYTDVANYTVAAIESGSINIFKLS